MFVEPATGVSVSTNDLKNDVAKAQRRFKFLSYYTTGLQLALKWDYDYVHQYRSTSIFRSTVLKHSNKMKQINWH